MNLGGLLRRDLAERAQECAREHGLPHCLSYGQSPAVCFERGQGPSARQLPACHLPHHAQKPKLTTTIAEGPFARS
jgi:hypothetical protein